MDNQLLRNIKQSELQYGRSLVSAMGTMKAIEISGSNHGIKRIMANDSAITLDMLLLVNAELKKAM